MTKLKGLLSFIAICLLLNANAASAGTGECSETQKCAQGCCSSSGYCGYGPDYCGKKCISSCDAQAECGQYAATPGKKCPLNVCCSEFGFCGTTSEFCGKKCQSGCDKPKRPSCNANSRSAEKKRIGYYESWTKKRKCNVWDPIMIDANKWTHINYAFALIDGSTYHIAQMNSFDTELYPQVTGLKADSPGLKVYISLGGWDAGGAIFSKMMSTEANRQAFIQSAIKFMKTYAFDGIDIDWEYPVADDRGGEKADFSNFVTFLKELRSAVGDDFGVTATLPSSYWYLQGFDVAAMEPYLDWFNMMTYDIHGTWDGNNAFTKAEVRGHTNLTEIDESLNLMWRNNIDPSKVILGLGFYGRSFTLKDPRCKDPGCPFSGGAKPGKCTDTEGILSYDEIKGIIKEHDLTPKLDEAAAVKYMSWDNDQWVSYDDSQTFAMKLKYANEKCLGGTMVWALDLDSVGDVETDDRGGSDGFGSGIDALLKSSSSMSIPMRTTLNRDNSPQLGIFWTACLPPGTTKPCPDGFNDMFYGHGKVFDADVNHMTGEGCHGGGRHGFNRALCVDKNIAASCQWGPGSKSKACNSKCPAGWITLTKNSHIAGQDTGCKSGKYAPLCCDYVKTWTDPDHQETCYNSYRDHMLGGGLALGPYITTGRSFKFKSIGDGSVAAEKHDAFRKRHLGEENALENGKGTGGVALNKRGIFAAGGCHYAMAPDQIGLDIPAVLVESLVYEQQSITFWSMSASVQPTKTVPRKKPTRTVHETTTITTYSTEARTCDGKRYPQACMHYSSVARVYTNDNNFQKPTCANADATIADRPMVDDYDDQHHKVWSSYIAKSYTDPSGKRKDIRCQRDEWPPNLFMNGGRLAYIRLLPGGQNGGVANYKKSGWKGLCKYPPKKEVKVQGGPVVDVGAYYLVTSYTSSYITLNVMDYSFTDVSTPAGDPDGLKANPCWPSVLINDYGFQLLVTDNWYIKQKFRGPAYYAKKPTDFWTSGKSQPIFKRALVDGGEEPDREPLFLVDEGNSTRRATEEELVSDFGLQKCESQNCEDEALSVLQHQADMGLPTMPIGTDTAPVATTSASGPGQFKVQTPPPTRPSLEGPLPTATQSMASY